MSLNPTKIQELGSLLLVGALWGCTNPLLRKGSLDAQKHTADNNTSMLRSLLQIQVWFPYILNQCGSILFYVTLRNSDLAMAVPICNALALVFSVVTSFLLREPISQPIRTLLGATLILIGVTVCLSEDGDDKMVEHESEMVMVASSSGEL
jgi:drug/metabolite transporter (DMT)-like permease